jgi:hypothetical protein
MGLSQKERCKGRTFSNLQACVLIFFSPLTGDLLTVVETKSGKTKCPQDEACGREKKGKRGK